MRNKYKGICYKCGKEVAVGAGHFERNGKGGWRVQHAEHARKVAGKVAGDEVELNNP